MSISDQGSHEEDGARDYDPQNPTDSLGHVLDIDDRSKRAGDTVRILYNMVAAGMDIAAQAEVRSYVLQKRLIPAGEFDKAVRAARRSARLSRDDSEDANQATQIQALAREHYRLLIAEDGKPYAVELDGPNIAVTVGKQFARQLMKLFLEKTGTAPGPQAVSMAIQILLAYLDGQEPESVHLRLAREGSRVILDLGTKDGRCVIVDSAGWKIADRSPVLFRRGVGTSLPDPEHHSDGLPDPEHDHDGLNKLKSLVNLNETQFRLGVAWLVATLVPGIPHPILVTRGEQGTAKTTLARIFQRLIDPSWLDPGALPDNEKDLAVRMHNAYVQAFDNASAIPEWLSDALCRAATGGTFAGRLLYSDDEISVLTYLRIIILTTVEAGQLRADLVERMLPLDLDRIEPGKRKTERAVIGDNPDDKPGVFDLLDQGHGAILGSLLDLLSGVLKHIPDVAIEQLPRMADFAKVIAALDADQEWETFDLYSALVDTETGALVEGNAFATRLVSFMADKTDWTGTATDLRDALTALLPDKEHPPKGWPADATRAGGFLKRMAPSLRVHGIEVDYDREGKSRSRTYKVRKIASAASQRPPKHSEQPKPADASADAGTLADAEITDRRTLRTLADAGKSASVRPVLPGHTAEMIPADAADADFSNRCKAGIAANTESSQLPESIHPLCDGCGLPLDHALVAAGFTSHGGSCIDSAAMASRHPEDT